MTSELAMKSKEIESQVANHIRNLQMELESYQQRLKEEQDIARRATAQGDRSENAEWQIANDAIARINVSIMSLSDTIATYKKFSTSYIPTGKVMVGSTLLSTSSFIPLALAMQKSVPFLRLRLSGQPYLASQRVPRSP